MMKKLFVLLLCICMLAGIPALAEEEKVYLALGDSITTGYGLAPDEPGFANLVAREGGYTLINRAINGNTMPGLLAQLMDPAVLADAAKARLITITCGGNDLMGMLFQEIAGLYNQDVPALLQISAGDIPQIMMTPDDPRQQAIFMAAQTALCGNAELGVPSVAEGDAIQTALVSYVMGLNSAIKTLRTVNPDALIVLATQYNPFAGFTAPYDGMNAAVEIAVQKLSQVIAINAPSAGYAVADVYAAFTASSENLYNAAMEPLNLDVHPNAAGHALIAQCMLETPGVK